MEWLNPALTIFKGFSICNNKHPVCIMDIGADISWYLFSKSPLLPLFINYTIKYFAAIAI